MRLRAFFRNSNTTGDAELAVLRERVTDLERQLQVDMRPKSLSGHYFFEQFENRAFPGDFVMLLDVDDFQSVNNDYGLEVGERLILGVAEALRTTLGERGVITRFENDRFLVLTQGVGDAGVASLADDLMRVVQTVGIPVGELTVTRQASVGVIPVTGCMTGKEAVALADAALVAAKRAGKNRVERRTLREVRERPFVPSVEEVRLALQRGEIGYHVQPIVDLATLRPTGYEALMRWHRPNGEVVGPGHFLETMTSALDVRTTPPFGAAHRTAAWVVHERNAFISFNVSKRCIEQMARLGPAWVRTLVGDIPLDRVVLELVETIADCDKSEICEIVARLRGQGIRVALDDFGIGRSTLERLQRIPVDIVKVDKHFLHMADRSERDMKILRCIVDLSRSTGAISVIEGVETQRHLEVARGLGADWAQGFLFGRPAAISDGLSQAG